VIGRPTPRQQLRELIRAQHSMDAVERYARQGVISYAAFERFERLWALTTATEHWRTRTWSVAKWRARRDRGCAAINAFLAATG
jgi:hypothetical protein